LPDAYEAAVRRVKQDASVTLAYDQSL
jgi:hypothetical protein